MRKCQKKARTYCCHSCQMPETTNKQFFVVDGDLVAILIDNKWRKSNLEYECNARTKTVYSVHATRKHPCIPMLISDKAPQFSQKKKKKRNQQVNRHTFCVCKLQLLSSTTSWSVKITKIENYNVWAPRPMPCKKICFNCRRYAFKPVGNIVLASIFGRTRQKKKIWNCINESLKTNNFSRMRVFFFLFIVSDPIIKCLHSRNCTLIEYFCCIRSTHTVRARCGCLCTFWMKNNFNRKNAIRSN